MISRIVGIRIWNREIFRHLLQHGKTHGDMKPVDDMLCPRGQPLGPRPYRVAAIGDESDGLMVYDRPRLCENHRRPVQSGGRRQKNPLWFDSVHSSWVNVIRI